jgi:CheY-like chemotaxis protein
MQNKAKRVLLVGDDELLRMTRNHILQNAGYVVDTAATLDDALARCCTEHFDAVLISGQSQEHALKECERIRSAKPDQLVIVIAQPNCYIPPDACPDKVVEADPKEMLQGIDSALHRL